MHHVSDLASIGKEAELLEVYVEEAVAYAIAQYNAIADQCASPIERLMMIALLIRWGYPACRNRDNFVVVSAQAPIGKYRADFLITHKDKKVVVECDGHDFHERTKHQAQRDKSRDRWMVGQGYAVLRFTGSEIFLDARSCVDEVARVIGL